jgi:hypothetical protein
MLKNEKLDVLQELRNKIMRVKTLLTRDHKQYIEVQQTTDVTLRLVTALESVIEKDHLTSTSKHV